MKLSLCTMTSSSLTPEKPVSVQCQLSSDVTQKIVSSICDNFLRSVIPHRTFEEFKTSSMLTILTCTPKVTFNMVSVSFSTCKGIPKVLILLKTQNPHNICILQENGCSQYS